MRGNKECSPLSLRKRFNILGILSTFTHNEENNSIKYQPDIQKLF